MTDDPYTLILTDDAQDDLKRLAKTIAQRIIRRLRWLAANADTYSHRALTGQWRGFYRFRIGDYRVIYALDRENRVITVIVIGHRRDVYDE